MAIKIIKKINLSENAKQILEFRYLTKKDNGEKETPKEMFERVAKAVASVEKTEILRKYWGENFLWLFMNLYFLPNTPALINAGKSLGELNACYVIPVEDSVEGIFDAIKNAAVIHKGGGGTGFSFSKIRPEGNKVRKTNGVASGPVSFLKVFDSATSAMKQGGVRRGANMGVLSCEHEDIEKFIDLKKEEGIVTNFNLSVAITNRFMRCVKTGENLVLNWNKENERVIYVKKIWNKIIKGVWKNGEPGIIFIDQVNNKNVLKNIEQIDACNPCAEQYLPDWGSCNLGSINLSKFVIKYDDITGYEINYDLLSSVINMAVRYLDNTIDVSNYSLSEIEYEAKRKRRIGLGIMGLADMFLKLEINYESDKALSVAEKIMSFVHKTAIRESQELAKEKGIPNLLKENNFIRRNATLTTIAPTGSLSLIADCSSGCEPIFSYKYTKKCIDSELEIIHPLAKIYFDKNEKLPDRFIMAKDICMEQHIKMQAVLQKWVHSGISKTINAPKDTTIEEVDKAFQLCYELGCKSISFYREGSRVYEALVSKKENESYSDSDINIFTEEKQRPISLIGYTKKVLTSRGKLYITVNELGGLPFEVFLHIGKAGAEDFAYSEALGRMISLALRSNIQVEKIVKHLINISGSGQVWNKNIPIKSIPDAVAKVLSEKYCKNKEIISDKVCPSCGDNSIVMQGGCDLCLVCGWTKCN